MSVEGWHGGRVGGWKGRSVEWWKGGRLEGWKAGMVQVWEGGRVKGWKGGSVGGWKGGRLQCLSRSNYDLPGFIRLGMLQFLAKAFPLFARLCMA